MNAVMKLTRIHARDVLRSRWLLAYTGCFLALGQGVVGFSGSDAKALLSLGAVTVMLVPLAALLVATTYVSGAREFMEALLAQPVRRTSLFAGVYLGLAGPMAAAFAVGAGLPLVRTFADAELRSASVVLLAVGVLLTFSFTAIGCCLALRVEDRLRGLGAALAAWLALAVLYDAGVLALVAMLSGHPIEKPLLALTFANPVDLGRVLLLLELDVAALMGYTGAAFERFFSGALGATLAACALALWSAVPAVAAMRMFRRKDF
jgi:Cu-processing system permease protein